MGVPSTTSTNSLPGQAEWRNTTPCAIGESRIIRRYNVSARLRHPVFIANGDSDPMIPPHFSHLLAGLIPQAKIKIYPDAAHGFLFQHASEFAADVNEFLNDSGSTDTEPPAASISDV